MARFKDRTDAGRHLAEALQTYRNRDDVIVLGLPRGGVPVALQIAKALEAPLDVYIVRKLGTPGQEELAMGAIASNGARILNEQVIRTLGLSESQIGRVAQREQEELQRREQIYRGDRKSLVLENKTVILIDDGLATGASMKVAVQAVQASSPRELVVAVGTAPEQTLKEFKALDGVDEVIAAEVPEFFHGVGGSFDDFSQTTDDDVIECLKQAPKRP